MNKKEIVDGNTVGGLYYLNKIYISIVVIVNVGALLWIIAES